MTFQASGQNFSTLPAPRPSPSRRAARSACRQHLHAGLPATLPSRCSSPPRTGLARYRSPGVPHPSFGGSFSTRLTGRYPRCPPDQDVLRDMPPGGERPRRIVSAPDHAADDPVYYYLFSPADSSRRHRVRHVDVTATDTTPTPDNPTGNASLIAPDPQPGLWEIDVMQGDTTDGTVFSQTVTGPRVQPAGTGDGDRSPGVDVEEHQLRHQRPDHGKGQEHDEPRRALRAEPSGTDIVAATPPRRWSWVPEPPGH